uniref:Uncharacterized protein n=1 Tax=Meloidogyne enterolobii TaxID=390850 RepID=A0A6V7WLL3_MELEN|nr:unnamed protein product [Meloidogyne enterolobii]
MSMDSTAELKYRREAAEFIQEMAERLNPTFHNTEDNWQNCCIRFNKKTELLVCNYLACGYLSPIDDDDPLDDFLMLFWLTTMLPKPRLDRLFNEFENIFKKIFLTCSTAGWTHSLVGRSWRRQASIRSIWLWIFEMGRRA